MERRFEQQEERSQNLNDPKNSPKVQNEQEETDWNSILGDWLQRNNIEQPKEGNEEEQEQEEKDEEEAPQTTLPESSKLAAAFKDQFAVYRDEIIPAILEADAAKLNPRWMPDQVANFYLDRLSELESHFMAMEDPSGQYTITLAKMEIEVGNILLDQYDRNTEDSQISLAAQGAAEDTGNIIERNYSIEPMGSYEDGITMNPGYKDGLSPLKYQVENPKTSDRYQILLFIHFQVTNIK